MLIFIIVLIVLAGLIEYMSLRDTPDFMRYDTYSTKRLVGPGEDFELVSVFKNTRRVFLPFLDVQEILPVDIEIASNNLRTHYMSEHYTAGGDSTLHLRSTVYLLPRQRLERRVPAGLPKRGRYLLRGAVVRRGDFFGLRETYSDFPSRFEIIVFPAPAADDPRLTALGDFLGDISVRRFIMEDPVLIQGFVEYSGREPLRDISWVQSARLNRMMVKKYDYTLEPAVTVLLNVDCSDEKTDAGLLEQCFSITRTVCEQLEERRIKYKVASNAVPAGNGGRWPVITDGLGNNHLSGILECLGRATYDCSEPFDNAVERAVRGAEHGRSHIVVTPFEYDGLNTAVTRLKALTGGDALVISARK